MLRITVTQSTPTSKQLKLEGRVTGPSVEELRRQCEAALGPAAGVSSMDRSRWSLRAAKSDRLLQDNSHSSVTFGPG